MASRLDLALLKSLNPLQKIVWGENMKG